VSQKEICHLVDLIVVVKVEVQFVLEFPERHRRRAGHHWKS